MYSEYLAIKTDRAISSNPCGHKHFKGEEFYEFLVNELDLFAHKLRLIFLGGGENE